MARLGGPIRLCKAAGQKAQLETSASNLGPPTPSGRGSRRRLVVRSARVGDKKL